MVNGFKLNIRSIWLICFSEGHFINFQHAWYGLDKTNINMWTILSVNALLQMMLIIGGIVAVIIIIIVGKLILQLNGGSQIGVVSYVCTIYVIYCALSQCRRSMLSCVYIMFNRPEVMLQSLFIPNHQSISKCSSKIFWL